MRESNNTTILMVGNFLSGSRPYRLACEDLASRLEGSGWRILRTSKRPGRLARFTDIATSPWRWRRDYRAAQVDVFSARSFLWAEAACFSLQRARKPYVLTLRGGELPEFARRHPRRVARLLQSAYAVTVPSSYLGNRMVAYREDLVSIPNALDIGSYPFRRRESLRPNLVWLRAFHAIYNPPLAVDVLFRLLAVHPDARLRMIGPDRGDGSLRRTQDRAKELGVLDRVDITLGIPKKAVPLALDPADIFLNTTNVDNSPVSVLEAMACGLCVVSTDVGGVPALAEAGVDALLVPPNSPEKMAEAVLALLGDDTLAGRLSIGGRRKAESRDWERVLPVWEGLLRAACSHA